jgi:Leucine-rich repeat (LRR) protein
MPYLERLVVGNNRIQSIKNFKGGEKLINLDLSLNKLTSLAGLPNLPNLTYLGLEGNQLTTLEGLGELPQLRTVKLSKNRLESVDPLAALPMLESVDLKSNKITALPSFQREMARLEIEGNPIAAATTGPKKPVPRLVLPADAARVSSLPSINGRLYGGGTFHSKMTKKSNFAMATPSSFRFERSGNSLSGVAGLNFIPGLLSIRSVRVTISVEMGRARIYLKHPGDFKFVKDRYGKKRLTEIPTKDFIYADAAPGHPCTLQGQILRPKYCKYEVVLEALDGQASGLSYVITDTSQ